MGAPPLRRARDELELFPGLLVTVLAVVGIGIRAIRRAPGLRRRCRSARRVPLYTMVLVAALVCRSDRFRVSAGTRCRFRDRTRG